MNVILYPANQRKHVKIENKFNSWQSFSFGNWFDASKTNFYSLRVFNDDTIGSESEIGMHPHENYEILSVMINGKMSHKDSLENYQEIESEAIQLISCGSGIYHSGKNLNGLADTHFLQIWVQPNTLNTKPELSLKQFKEIDTIEKWDLRVSPKHDIEKIIIKQNCYCSRGRFSVSTKYKLYEKNNAVWLFIINGSIEVNGKVANKGDALMITNTELIQINILQKSDLWLMELA